VTVYAGMATIPSRIDVARKAIASLAPQCSWMYLHLDGHSGDWDSWYAHSNALVDHAVNATCGQWGRGAAWKFAPIKSGEIDDVMLPKPGDILLTCDDDFAYPPDYVATMVAALERAESANGRGCVVTAHGATHTGDWRRSYPDASATRGCRHMRRINVPGTGVMAARVSTIRDFPIPTTGDCREDPRFGVWCQRKGVPIYAVPHAAGWLRDLLPPDAPTLHRREGMLAEVQAILDEVDEWRLHGVVIDEPPRLHGIFR
jgi:hypothetical protein